MAEDKVVIFIKSYSVLKAKKAVMDSISLLNEGDKEDYERIKIQIQMIDSAMSLLTKEEKTIITLHLMDELKWNEISESLQGYYSERTLKRMQKKAVDKIENFVYSNHFEKYIDL